MILREDDIVVININIILLPIKSERQETRAPSARAKPPPMSRIIPQGNLAWTRSQTSKVGPAGWLAGLAGMMKRRMTMASVGVAEEITTGVSRLAQPAMKPGALKNQRRTRRVKRTRVETSWKVMGPSSLYFSLNISDTPLSEFPRLSFPLQQDSREPFRSLRLGRMK